MRILVVLHDFQPGGAERIAIRLAARWAASGAQVTIACGSGEGALRGLVGEQVHLALASRPIARSRFSRLAVASFAAQVARSTRPDVIFLPGNFYAGMAAVLKARLGRRCPSIVTKLSNALRRSDRGRFAQRAFALSLTAKTAWSDRIVVMSPDLLDEARNVLPWPSERYQVLTQPVLDDACPPGVARATGRADLAPLLVAAGRLIGQKNFAGLIDAVAALERPFRLVIYGEGPERALLANQIDQRGLADRVTLAGYVDALGVALSGARLFVLSSHYEGFPSVVIEALAAGVGVVATDCSPALRPILRAAGLRPPVPVSDAAALGAAIAAALDQPVPDRAKLMASVDGYRIGPSAADYLALFERLVSAR